METFISCGAGQAEPIVGVLRACVFKSECEYFTVKYEKSTLWSFKNISGTAKQVRWETGFLYGITSC